jgi:hypothetical protein
LVEIEAFLSASESVRLVGWGRTEIYGWVERLLCHHEYLLQKRRINGLLRAYVEHMTGLSLNALKRVAATMSDTEAARRMQQAKYDRFEQIRKSA